MQLKKIIGITLINLFILVSIVVLMILGNGHENTFSFLGIILGVFEVFIAMISIALFD